MSRPFNLVHAPYPFPGESAASWIHRTCQLHGVTYRTLTRYLGLKPTKDPDLATPHDHICHISIGTSVSFKQLKALADVFQLVREIPQLKRLLNFTGSAPTYHFRPCYLAENPAPYLRIQWRFKAWAIYPKHHCRVVGCCPTCGTAIQAARPCIDVVGKDTPSIVSYVKYRQSLVTSNEDIAGKVWVSPVKLSTQHTIVSAVRSGVFRLGAIRVPLSLGFMQWFIENPNLVKDCLARSEFQPEKRRDKLIMKGLIDTYCLQHGTKRSLEGLVRHRKRWLKKRRSSQAEANCEALIKRQASHGI